MKSIPERIKTNLKQYSLSMWFKLYQMAVNKSLVDGTFHFLKISTINWIQIQTVQ